LANRYRVSSFFSFSGKDPGGAPFPLILLGPPPLVCRFPFDTAALAGLNYDHFFFWAFFLLISFFPFQDEGLGGSPVIFSPLTALTFFFYKSGAAPFLQ